MVIVMFLFYVTSECVCDENKDHGSTIAMSFLSSPRETLQGDSCFESNSKTFRSTV